MKAVAGVCIMYTIPSVLAASMNSRKGTAPCDPVILRPGSIIQRRNVDLDLFLNLDHVDPDVREMFVEKCDEIPGVVQFSEIMARKRFTFEEVCSLIETKDSKLNEEDRSKFEPIFKKYIFIILKRERFGRDRFVNIPRTQGEDPMLLRLQNPRRETIRCIRLNGQSVHAIRGKHKLRYLEYRDNKWFVDYSQKATSLSHIIAMLNRDKAEAARQHVQELAALESEIEKTRQQIEKGTLWEELQSKLEQLRAAGPQGPARKLVKSEWKTINHIREVNDIYY